MGRWSSKAYLLYVRTPPSFQWLEDLPSRYDAYLLILLLFWVPSDLGVFSGLWLPPGMSLSFYGHAEALPGDPLAWRGGS